MSRSVVTWVTTAISLKMSLVDIDVAIRVIFLRSLGAIFNSGDHINRLDHDVSWVHSCHRRQVIIGISASQELLEGRQRLVWSRIEIGHIARRRLRNFRASRWLKNIATHWTIVLERWGVCSKAVLGQVKAVHCIVVVILLYLQLWIVLLNRLIRLIGCSWQDVVEAVVLARSILALVAFVQTVVLTSPEALLFTSDIRVLNEDIAIIWPGRDRLQVHRGAWR